MVTVAVVLPLVRGDGSHRSHTNIVRIRGCTHVTLSDTRCERGGAELVARLTRHRLVTVALELVDEEGGEALSMRALATRVDRQVSSLYNHVASRDDLIEAIRARVVAEIDT